MAQLCVFVGGQVEEGSVYRVTHMNSKIIQDKDWTRKGKSDISSSGCRDSDVENRHKTGKGNI